MGGIKRKIPLEKIEKKDSRAVAFSKRSKGLYSKASELCLLAGGQIAIIATPVSSKSNVSFYSFGHSSVDGVVDAFLTNKRPRDDPGQGFWWDDESLLRSENPEELRDAMNSMSKMLQDLKDLRFDALEKRGDHEDVKKKGVLHETHEEQTLVLQSSSSTLCIQNDPTANFEGFNRNIEEQILAVSDNNNNSGLTGNLDGCNQEFGLDQIFDFVKSEGPSMNLETDDVSMVTTNQNPLSDSEAVEGGELVMHRDWHENNLHLSDFDENQILSISDNNNALPENEGWCDQELDLDQMFDFETNCESLLMNLEKMYDNSMITANQKQCYDSEAVEDGGSVPHRDLDEDNLHFSDFFNDLASIAAL